MTVLDQACGPILIVDDDRTFSAFVQAVLEDAGHRTLVGASGEEALELARRHMPRVVLLDVVLPRLNGYEVYRALRDAYGAGLAVMFISGERTAAVDISSGLLVGADDYLVKPCDPSELVARVGVLARRVTATNGNGTTARVLTRRENEILRLLSDGLSQRDIATMLSISSKTVGLHIEHILGKLKVHSRAQAVAAAYRDGLLS